MNKNNQTIRCTVDQCRHHEKQKTTALLMPSQLALTKPILQWNSAQTACPLKDKTSAV